MSRRSMRLALDGCRAPDWYYVPGVPPMLEGRMRRSYVRWQEIVAPLFGLGGQEARVAFQACAERRGVDLEMRRVARRRR